MDLSANGARLRLFRDIGNIVLDVDGIEQVDINALGGTDNITVNSLSGTAVTQVNVDLAGSLGGNTGDTQPDTVSIVGTAAAETFNVSADAGFVVVDLPTAVRVKGYETLDQLVFNGVGGDHVNVNGSAGPDTMTITQNGTQALVQANGFSASVAVAGELSLAVNGLGGPDTISCTGNLAGLLIPLTLDGGPGDDTLLGSNGADILIGGEDNDFIDGNQGNDTVMLGPGDDTFQWDPGDGSDTIEGQGGTDRLRFNASNANDTMDLSANSGRLRLLRNIGNIVLDADGIEQVDINALGGTDNITVNSLSGTAVTQVNIDLASALGGSAGDLASDLVTLNGTDAADTISVTANAGVVEATGLAAQVRILHPEAAYDGLIVNGLAGVDTITVAPEVLTLLNVTVNQD